MCCAAPGCAPCIKASARLAMWVLKAWCRLAAPRCDSQRHPGFFIADSSLQAVPSVWSTAPHFILHGSKEWGKHEKLS